MQLIKPTALRENIYKILDGVIKTGNPQYIERKGHVIKIEASKQPSKLERLTPHNAIVGNPDDLISIKLEQ
ncbi:hypothetical protein A2690_04840 [Candidatus Roizmanbacteria bacterium RIFCSPHIGHO2_01_FULL_39_12b]|uniref:Antitoxin n=1 Tax=Candidatus Roizmanbacteria bacterium RIFCSPHIGHO2_01_FULL_39_12b TaxID=1802030 RepID=A0A1F7GCV2_9BACT|nr:MAG: hypothetical protein A2690_04840 [Candidatus Roizmanbacteria bacterium RIFCSPHIGHO2_01_FULL_39_12b]